MKSLPVFLNVCLLVGLPCPPLCLSDHPPTPCPARLPLHSFRFSLCCWLLAYWPTSILSLLYVWLPLLQVFLSVFLFVFIPTCPSIYLLSYLSSRITFLSTCLSVTSLLTCLNTYLPSCLLTCYLEWHRYRLLSLSVCRPLSSSVCMALYLLTARLLPADEWLHLASQEQGLRKWFVPFLFDMRWKRAEFVLPLG